ncbi:hypothetical protein GGS20DRAFT_589018 [Poronia punctata]|nr:hypothetical protein GGS20DRAFT_589018 [Poronia punctata]
MNAIGSVSPRRSDDLKLQQPCLIPATSGKGLSIPSSRGHAGLKTTSILSATTPRIPRIPHANGDSIKQEDDEKPAIFLRSIEPWPCSSDTDISSPSRNPYEFLEVKAWDNHHARTNPGTGVLVITKPEEDTSIVHSPLYKTSPQNSSDIRPQSKRTELLPLSSPHCSKRTRRESASHGLQADTIKEEWTFHYDRPAISCQPGDVLGRENPSDPGGSREGPWARNIESQDQSNANPTQPYRQDGAGNDGEGGSGNDERQGGGEEPSSTPSKRRDLPQLLRFACPYQAHEPFRSCFKPARNNPSGGCDGIKRLKQHLCRRHMASSRCQRCWISFDSRRKLESHLGHPVQCGIKERPANEVFMSEEHEKEINKFSLAGLSEEETWWAWFQLLIPEMRDRDLASLRLEYWPYYYSPPFLAPTSSLTNMPFLQSTTSTLGNGLFGDDHGNPQGLLPENPQAMFPAASSMPRFSLPPLELFDDLDRNRTVDPSVGSRPGSSLLTAASHTQPLSSGHDYRNYDRLRSRYSRLEAVNNILREANGESQANVGRAEEILENILVSVELPDDLYEKLSQIAEILSVVKERLSR